MRAEEPNGPVCHADLDEVGCGLGPAERDRAERGAPASLDIEPMPVNPAINRQDLDRLIASLEGRNAGGAETAPPQGDVLRLQWMVAHMADQQTRTVDQVQTLLRSMPLIRWLGWLIVLLAGIDYFVILMGVNWFDATSELKAIEAMIDRVLAPLIGMTLVFFGALPDAGRTLWHDVSLRVASWLCLVLGLAFLAVTPLTLTDTQRIKHAKDLALQTEHREFLQRWERSRKALEGAVTPQELNALLRPLNPGIPSIETADQLQRLKSGAVELLDGRLRQNIERLNAGIARNRRDALISVARLTLGGVLSGGMFIAIFFFTGWVRKGQ